MTTTLGIQERLIALGYNPGPPDGIDGPKTREAMKAFQRDKGVTVDGKVGPVTEGAIQVSGYLIGWASIILALPVTLVWALWLWISGRDLRRIGTED